MVLLIQCYYTYHHSKDIYLHNNKIVVAKIRLGMVVMLELEPPSIHILPQHKTNIYIILSNILKIAELDCCQIIILSIYVPSTHAYTHVLRLSLDLPYETRQHYDY